MRTDLDPAAVTALQQRVVEPRTFVWVTARDRDTGDPASVGFWDGLYDVTVSVISGVTGGTASRLYYGAGSLLSVEGIGGQGGLAAQEVSVRLSQIDGQVAQAFRGYDPTQAAIEIHTGIFTPGTNTLVDNPRAIFLGFVDEVEIRTPEEGGEGYIEARCQSHSRELTRTNTDTRSDQSQRRRDENDAGMIYAGQVAEWAPFWGQFDTRGGGGNVTK